MYSLIVSVSMPLGVLGIEGVNAKMGGDGVYGNNPIVQGTEGMSISLVV